MSATTCKPRRRTPASSSPAPPVAPPPRLQRYLDAAARLAPPGRVVTDRALAAEVGVYQQAASKARRRLKKLGFWRWRSGMTNARHRRATEDKVAAAGARIARSGVAMTVRAVAREAKVSHRAAREAIRRLEERGRWDWAMGWRVDPLAILARAPGPTKRDPTLSEIMAACRTILVENIGLGAEAVDGRLAMKAIRYGGGPSC